MKYIVNKIDEQTYQIRYYFLSAADVCMYLLIGEEKAMLIDSGYAGAPIDEILSPLTDKPIFAVHTHGHLDHIGCSSHFDQAYLSAKDFDVATIHSNYKENRRRNRHVIAKRPALRLLLLNPKLAKEMDSSCRVPQRTYTDYPESMSFDLGDRCIQVIPCPGHTEGSVLFLDSQRGYLFSGDSICDKGVLLGFDESTSLSIFKRSLLNAKAVCLSNHVTSIFPGHHTPCLDCSMIDAYLQLIEMIENNQVESVYTDNGTCCGCCAANETIKIIYKKEL